MGLLGIGFGVALCLRALLASWAGAELGLEPALQMTVALGLALTNTVILYAKLVNPRLLYRQVIADPVRLVELDARLTQREVVRERLRQGQKIRAITLYRDATGASVEEARAAVEAMQAELRGQPGG